MGDRLIVVSSDSHAGMPKELWPEYLPAKFHDLLPDLRRDNEIYPVATSVLGARRSGSHHSKNTPLSTATDGTACTIPSSAWPKWTVRGSRQSTSSTATDASATSSTTGPTVSTPSMHGTPVPRRGTAGLPTRSGSPRSIPADRRSGAVRRHRSSRGRDPLDRGPWFRRDLRAPLHDPSRAPSLFDASWDPYRARAPNADRDRRARWLRGSARHRVRQARGDLRRRGRRGRLHRCRGDAAPRQRGAAGSG